MNEKDLVFLKRSIELAKESVDKCGFPAGALVVKDGEVIAEGISIGNILHDPTSHAETAAIREACKVLETTDLNGATLYESLQSCIMCFSVAYWSGVSRIVYAAKKTPKMVTDGFYEGTTDNAEINSNNNRQIELIHIPDLEQESLAVIKEWEAKL